MTSYHGGKQKIGKQIASVINNYIYQYSEYSEYSDYSIKGYCEPFCGMLGVYQHVYTGIIEEVPKNFKFLAGDYNESLIMMWKKAQKGWMPPKYCSEEKYEKLKNSTKPSAEKGFIGHQYSYGGQYFKGYRGKYKNKDRYEKAAENVSNIAKSLKNVKFKHGSYTQFSKLKGYVIYCDPPYSVGESYYFDEKRNRLQFDHIEFWKWCIKMSNNNIVFVSDYSFPSKQLKKELGFIPKVKTVFRKKVNLTGASPKNRQRIEKLYIFMK
jgi:site-specific DNA-adenine methylase